MALDQDYFSLFGLPRSFSVDRELLDTRYRELQRSVHPDRFASASEQERRVSMQQAAEINEGYRILKDALARGRYLLELRGHSFADEQATHQDPEFLMEQMELREALAEVRDGGDPLGELQGLIARIDERLAALNSTLAASLAADDSTVPEEALVTLQRMQFFRKLEQEAEELEADLEDF